MRRALFALAALALLLPAASFAFSTECSGGTITRSGGQTIHTFTTSGTLDCTAAGSGTANVLVVAGGGGGASGNSGNNDGGGGGGAGGYQANTALSISASSYTVTVGGGGSQGTAGGCGSNGTDSSLDVLLSATGGGKGGCSGTNGGNGGSGGGGASTGSSRGTGTGGQGNNGGSGATNGGGAGGGSSSTGGDGSGSNGGIGGSGTANSITASSVTYSCGGGGGASGPSSTGGAAGCSNAGTGGDSGTTGGNGTANTGGGGGGGGRTSNQAGGNGGSGIVVVSYGTPKSYNYEGLWFGVLFVLPASLVARRRAKTALAGAAVAIAVGAAAMHGFQKERPDIAPTYFAQIDASGTVQRVIVADQAFIDSGKVGDPASWKQTYLDGHKRKRYAGRGFRYDKSADAFVAPTSTAIMK